MALLLLRASLVLFMALSPSCSHTCSSTGDVRLVGGRAPSEGIVEICLNSQWGTVCNHSWDYHHASVVCQQLGYPTGNYPYSGNGSGPIHLDYVNCWPWRWHGYSRLIDCYYSSPTSDCSHSDDVGVHCIATPGAPQDLVASDICSTSLTLLWQPPTQTYGIDIKQYHVVCANQVNQSSTELSVYVNGLQPDTTFECCVSAVNIAADKGPRACTTVRTLQNASSAAPQIVDNSIGSTAISLEWRPPPYQYCIRHYSIIVREVNTGTQTKHTSTTLQTTINQLHPYYTYEFRVAAYTTREGVLSQPVTLTTAQDAPSAAPENIRGYASGSTSIYLNWSPPPLQHHNGIISSYYINVTEVNTGTQTQHTRSGLQTTINRLHPYYTYECRVAAYTISEGVLSQPFTITTDQDVPSAPPENITTSDVSTTYVRLHWIPPPTEHHNGVITGYVVWVTMANTQESYNLTSNRTELLVDSLTPDSEYYFTVAAQTVIGIGPFSATITQQTETTPISTALVAGAVTAFLAILAALLIVIVVGYFGYRKLGKKQLKRKSGINAQRHVYDDIPEPRQQEPEKAIHNKPHQHVQTDIDAQRRVYDDVEPEQQKTGRAIHVKSHKRVQTALQGKEVKRRNKPRFSLHNILFRREQQSVPDESTDPSSKLQSLTFYVSDHIRAFLEQEENSQNLTTEVTAASFCEDEPPPPIPERLYLDKEDTPPIPERQRGETRLQDFLVQKGDKMNGPASSSDHIYHPLLPRRQPYPKYEVTQSDSKCQDKELPTAAENNGKQINSPASDHIYQPLLQSRGQQENAEYQSLHFKN